MAATRPPMAAGSSLPFAALVGAAVVVAGAAGDEVVAVTGLTLSPVFVELA